MESNDFTFLFLARNVRCENVQVATLPLSTCKPSGSVVHDMQSKKMHATSAI